MPVRHVWWLSAVIRETQDIVFFHLDHGLYSQGQVMVQGDFYNLNYHIWVLGLKEKEKEIKGGEGTPWSWVSSL